MQWEDRVIGIILGGATGDSLGMPWEGESSENIKRECPSGPWDHFDGRQLTDVKVSAKLAGVSLGPCRIGEYTDDTECLLALSDSLIQMGGLHGEHASLNTCAWWKRGNTGGYSAWVFQKFTSICKRECRYNNTEQLHDNPSYGNGAIMRIGPLAPIYKPLRWRIPELRAVVKAALISTHTHVEAIDSAVVLCVALMHCLDAVGSEFSMKPFLEEVTSVPMCDELKTRLVAITEKLLQEVTDSATTDMYNAVDKEFLQSICTKGKWFQIRAVDALTYVLYVFCKYQHNPEEAMVRMIALGGDCDTLACILGQLLGALHGHQWIPKRWTEVMKCDPMSIAKQLAGVQRCETLVMDAAEDKLQQLWKEIDAAPFPVRHAL